MTDMEPLVFCLHFRGQASRGSDKRNLFRVTASAPSCNLGTELSETGIAAHVSVLPGDMAFSESEIEVTGASAFTGKASLSFGDGPHALELIPTAPGQFDHAAHEGSMTGAITWQIASGEGQFEGAKGFVTSVVSVREDGQFSEYQTGVVYLRKS